MKLQISATLLLAALPWVHGAPARRDTTNPGLRGSESLIGYSSSNKGGSDSPPDIKYTLLPGQKEDPNIGSYLDFQKADNPQPIRGSTGSDDPGPSKFSSTSRTLKYKNTNSPGNYNYDRINSDKLAPPGTDHGQTINAQWPMGKFTSHMEIERG
jgi:hypothetical protein